MMIRRAPEWLLIILREIGFGALSLVNILCLPLMLLVDNCVDELMRRQ